MRKVTYPATGEVFLDQDEVRDAERAAVATLARDLHELAARLAPELAAEPDAARCESLMCQALAVAAASHEANLRRIAEDA